MEQAYYIRNKYRREDKSFRQIARETKHDFATVKKYVEMENFSPSPPIKRNRKGKATKYREIVLKWLKEDELAPRKQRHTAHRVFTRLREHAQNQGKELDISERSVRNLVAALKSEITAKQPVYLPLTHPAGEAQVDFGDTVFFEKGIRYEGHHLSVTFPHSDGKFVQLFKGENLECLMEGLVNIFNHVGKSPTVIRFDNMSTAVKKILAYGEREVTDGFRRLMEHYHFQSNFCNPAKGNEKGSVENYVGTSRRNYFVPVPRITDLKEYNQSLLQMCSNDMKERTHYKLHKLVSDLFQEDLRAMNHLPKYEFEACKYTLAKTNKFGYVKFETNSYSTTGSYESKKIVIKATAMQVVLYDNDSNFLVAHPRIYGKGEESTIWAPYLPLIAQRPMALRYTGFYDDLPAETKDFFDQCNLPERKKALKFLSKMSEMTGYANAITTIDHAISLGAKDADSLISAYRHITDSKLPEIKMQLPPYFPETADYKVNLDVYMGLLPDVRHE